MRAVKARKLRKIAQAQAGVHWKFAYKRLKKRYRKGAI
jgi:hypothetical protein